MKSPAGYAESLNYEETLRMPRLAKARRELEKVIPEVKDEFPYGHPFWLGKPSIEEFGDSDNTLLLLDLFQGGHCFLNGIKRTPCHCDSYMTVLDYDAVDRTFKIIQDEFSLPKEKWIAFCDFWLNHANRQPITYLLGMHLKRKFE